jgi:hypothetical protein
VCKRIASRTLEDDRLWGEVDVKWRNIFQMCSTDFFMQYVFCRESHGVEYRIQE